MIRRWFKRRKQEAPPLEPDLAEQIDLLAEQPVGRYIEITPGDILDIDKLIEQAGAMFEAYERSHIEFLQWKLRTSARVRLGPAEDGLGVFFDGADGSSVHLGSLDPHGLLAE
jgi:hypothetical protein